MSNKSIPWNKGISLVKCVCLGCGKEFDVQQCKINQGGGKYCSSLCYKPRKSVLKKICEVCEKQFETKREDARFCSSVCSGKSRTRKDRGFCLECKKELEYLPSKKQIFCSSACANFFRFKNEYQIIIKKCLNCEKEMSYRVVNETAAKIKIYCSKNCYFEHNKDRIIAGVIKGSKENAHIISQKTIERHKIKGHPMLGKHQSEETKEKISKSHIGIASGEKNPMYGKNHSQQSREKMSETRSKKWIEGEYNSIFQKGYIYSDKMKCDIYYRSSWEKEFIFYLENNESIKQFFHDFIRVPYYDTTNNKRHYIVDFLIIKNDNSKELIEIKPLSFIDKDINKLKFTAARKYCKEQGMKFKVLTEKYLRHIGLDI